MKVKNWVDALGFVWREITYSRYSTLSDLRDAHKKDGWEGGWIFVGDEYVCTLYKKISDGLTFQHYFCKLAV